MSRLFITFLSVCALACFAGVPRSAHVVSHGFRTGPTRPRTGILTPAQRERALEVHETMKRDPRAAGLLPETTQPDDVDLIIASMCHALYGPCDEDPATAHRPRILYCSTRDSYPGTGDPEPFLSLLFSGPRLWVLGASTVVLFLEALARLVALTGATTSLVRFTSRAA